MKRQICSLTNVPVDQQDLLYAGKLLKGDWSLLNFGIEEGATLNFILRPQGSHGPQRTPAEAFDENGAESTFESWQKIAIDNDFDDDLHIVDPHAHYSRLRSLEQKVIKASEWFHCQGKYDIHDDELSETVLGTRPASTPEWV